MANNQNDKQDQSNESLAERATSLFQGGIDAVKNNPGTAAAVLGGVAAAAAAYVNRDKVVETAGNLREKIGGSGKADEQA